MQTDIYCIGKQWCTSSPQNHLQYCSNSWDHSLLRRCPSRVISPSGAEFKFLMGLLAHLFPIAVSFHNWSFQGTWCYFLTVENADLAFLGSQTRNTITTGETVQGAIPKVSQASRYCLNPSDTKLDVIFATVLKVRNKTNKATSRYIIPYCKPQSTLNSK